MKRLILLSLVSLFALSTYAQEGNGGDAEPTKASFAKFDKKIHNFGILEYNGDGTCSFTFTNTSDETMFIKNVRTSCGCTTPDYTKEPVAPGETGVVKAKYDTKRVGTFHKTVTVIFMDDSQVRLTIKGNVKPKPENNDPANG